MSDSEMPDDLKGALRVRHDLTPLEAGELYELLIEMLPLGFTTSKQLSNHIAQHRLGRKYPNISGVVRMAEGDKEWDLKGGFPPRVYGIICTELDLTNQGTTARPVGFTPFKEFYDAGRR
jgi:hypothetical protein